MPEDSTKNEPSAAHRSGFVAIVGRPNVGKSTLLNQLLGEKVAIVTPKPQTTRNRIRGIKTTPRAQIVFVDTPGIHRASSLMNRRMVEAAVHTLSEVDVVLWLVDATRPLTPEDHDIAQTLNRSPAPVIVLLNKMDLVDKPALLPLMEKCSALLPGKEILPISAATGENVDTLLELLIQRLPEGPRYYPEDELTDQTERFVAAEIIREKVFLLTEEEIPYHVAVTVDEFQEKPEKNLIVIKATIYTERESHKAILIGKRGAKLKEIGTRAREELEPLLGCRVFLELFVKVQPGWTQNPRTLAEFGL
ncbi:MAG TPA: GTPase Era [Candidatus Acidoferrales bacterium]|nr:GTPase Era [Candidatus Acidoferrales bacterium]